MKRTPSLATLRLFLEVARTRSFSAAARKANLSQPALSRTIQGLEDDLGVRVFDRTSRTVALTRAGEELLVTIERLIGDYDQAFGELAQSFAGQRGRIVVGALPSIAAHILPRILADFGATHPDVEIVVRDNLAATSYQQLQDRQVDFAITTPPDRVTDVLFHPLLDDACVLVGRSADFPPDSAPAAWADFVDHPFIAMAPGSSVRLLTDTAFIRAEIDVRPRYECAQLATVGGLIAAGLGITALPLSVVPLAGIATDLAWRPLGAPRAYRTIGVAQLAGRSLSPAADALRLRLTQAMGSAVAARPC